MTGLAIQLKGLSLANKENIMEIKLSANAQIGFDYIASKEGKTVEAIVSESIERQGLAFFEDKERGENELLVKAVMRNPSAYKAAISAIKVVEDKREADELAAKEAEVVK